MCVYRKGMNENEYPHNTRDAFDRFRLCLCQTKTQSKPVKHISCTVKTFTLIHTLSTQAITYITSTTLKKRYAYLLNHVYIFLFNITKALMFYIFFFLFKLSKHVHYRMSLISVSTKYLIGNVKKKKKKCISQEGRYFGFGIKNYLKIYLTRSKYFTIGIKSYLEMQLTRSISY